MKNLEFKALLSKAISQYKTQKEFAIAAHMSFNHVSRLLKAETKPNEKTIRSIVEASKGMVTIEELVNCFSPLSTDVKKSPDVLIAEELMSGMQTMCKYAYKFKYINDFFSMYNSLFNNHGIRFEYQNADCSADYDVVYYVTATWSNSKSKSTCPFLLNCYLSVNGGILVTDCTFGAKELLSSNHPSVDLPFDDEEIAEMMDSPFLVCTEYSTVPVSNAMDMTEHILSTLLVDKNYIDVDNFERRLKQLFEDVVREQSENKLKEAKDDFGTN